MLVNVPLPASIATTASTSIPLSKALPILAKAGFPVLVQRLKRIGHGSLRRRPPPLGLSCSPTIHNPDHEDLLSQIDHCATLLSAFSTLDSDHHLTEPAVSSFCHHHHSITLLPGFPRWYVGCPTSLLHRVLTTAAISLEAARRAAIRDPTTPPLFPSAIALARSVLAGGRHFAFAADDDLDGKDVWRPWAPGWWADTHAEKLPARATSDGWEARSWTLGVGAPVVKTTTTTTTTTGVPASVMVMIERTGGEGKGKERAGPSGAWVEMAYHLAGLAVGMENTRVVTFDDDPSAGGSGHGSRGIFISHAYYHDGQVVVHRQRLNHNDLQAVFYAVLAPPCTAEMRWMAYLDASMEVKDKDKQQQEQSAGKPSKPRPRLS